MSDMMRKNTNKFNPLRNLVWPFALIVGCGADGGGGSSSESEGGGASVTQPGAQDIGLFRGILEDGGLPGSETLDELGFFAEHKLELGEATCGENLCLEPQVGTMANMISGSTCTLVLVGLTTPIDPSEYDKPPLDLVVSVDTSGSMVGDPITYVREGLEDMLGALSPDDRVTLVTYADEGNVLVENARADAPELVNAIASLEAAGQTNIYDGLRQAFEQVPAAEEGRDRRVVLLSDGVATSGLDDDARIQAMAEGYAAQGIGLTTIGVGTEFDIELMRGLAEVGGGNFYYLEDPRAVLEVFTEEVESFLVPVATDVSLSIDAGDDYLLSRVHGTRLWLYSLDGADIEIPAFYLAGRESDDDQTLGRRGGGSAIIAELLPAGGFSATPEGGVGSVSMSWTDPESGEALSTQANMTLPAGGAFETSAVEKAFVMLNIYMGFEMATERAEDGALNDAYRILVGLRAQVAAWLAENPDEDIEADVNLIDMFVANLVAAGAIEPPPSAVPPPEPWYYD